MVGRVAGNILVGMLVVSVPVMVLVAVAFVVVVAMYSQNAASIVCRKAGQAAVVLYQPRAQPNVPALRDKGGHC